MSTNALINVLCNDGKVRSSYCHFDGNTRLPILKQFYNSQEDAEDLVHFGDISFLEGSTACPPGHNFDHPVEGYTVFYGRDRGEDNVGPEIFNSFKEAARSRKYCQYVYEWDGEWKKVRNK